MAKHLGPNNTGESIDRRDFLGGLSVGGATAAAGMIATATEARAMAAPPTGATAFSVRDFGAAGNGMTLDTKAIQDAVDAAHVAGGGTVVLNAGTYLSGTIFLKSRVTLHLEAGATLLGSTDLADFPEIPTRFPSYTDNYVHQALIYGESVEDVAITGRGIIDGQGAVYNERTKDYLVRPYLIRMVLSRNILVEGVTIKDSPMWVQHYLACEYVTLRGLRILSQVAHNNDMIDIDCCSNVHISDCYGKTGDDCITLKSTADRICENVTVTNCVLSSRCNAIKLGTESNGGFRNITISNCTINSLREPTQYSQRTFGISGIALELVDGGLFEDVIVSNITMRGVRVPIFLRLGNRARPFIENGPTPKMGTFRNVILNNIIATAVHPIGCSITGLPGHPIRNVTLENISLSMPGGGTSEAAVKTVDENADAYPKAHMFGMLPAYGFYCRHVDGLAMSNVHVACTEPDMRPALICDDVIDLDLDGFRDNNPATTPTAVVLKDVHNASMRGCTAGSKTGAYLTIAGQSRHINLTGNDFSMADTGWRTEPSIPKDEVFAAANREA
jgi:polygalacturonase